MTILEPTGQIPGPTHARDHNLSDGSDGLEMIAATLGAHLWPRRPR
jgi:hypothetical protein